MTDFPSSELWDFTLSVYRQEGVSQACIALQDRQVARQQLATDFNLTKS